MTTIAYVLSSIGGWHVGCLNHQDHQREVEACEKNGWATRRIHYAPAIPEGAAAFEITDKGLDMLRCWYGEQSACRAETTRQWYRINTSKPPEAA